jgi:hypothetical protein
MKKIKYILSTLIFISTGSTGYTLENKSNKYYFADLFNTTITDEKSAENILKNKSGNKDLLRQAGVYYFIKTSGLKKSDSDKIKYARKTIDIFENLWKRDRKNDLTRLQLGYGYSSLGDTDIEMEEMIDYVFKARNLFSMVVASLPDNIDARLARNRINMNLPADAGRPDDMVLEDSLKYIEIYEKLDMEAQQNESLLMGIMEMRLAAAMIYENKKLIDEAKKHFRLIDKKYLNDYIMNYYQELTNKLGK